MFADPHDVVEHVLDSVGIEGEHVGVTPQDIEGVLDVAGRYGADPAQVLGEDEVGLDALDQVSVERVQGLAVLDRLPHSAVHVRRRRSLTEVQLAAGHDGLAGGAGREVAAVGDRFDLVPEAEGEGDLCCRRKKGDDPQSTGRFSRYRARSPTPNA